MGDAMTGIESTILTVVIQGGSFALLAWYVVIGLDKRDRLLTEQRRSTRRN
jgi:hypothetical protein